MKNPMIMKRVTSLLILVTMYFSIACQPTLEETNSQLREEVIAVHDEVMPMMGKLKSFEKQAQEKIAKLEQEENVDEARVEELKALAFDLNKAYDGMFVWMRQYEVEDGDKSPEEVESYLKEQLVLVSKVNEDITAALEKAERVIGA